jgi:hypothetical protein
LAAAIALSIARKPSAAALGGLPEANADGGEEMTRWRSERLRIVLVFGIALPAALTFWLTYRRRRGGSHARGITIDITGDGELRIWGRGYGERVALHGADVSERLVDVYGGRLGAWRQRRVRVRAGIGAASAGLAARAAAARVIELATQAAPDDDGLELRLEGGEGDCLELGRADYLRLLAALRSASGEPDGQAQATETTGPSSRRGMKRAR